LLKWYLSQAKAHEDGWLYDIITGSKPLILSGAQGAAKSSFAAALLILQHLNDGRQIEVIGDVHAATNQEEKWDTVIKFCPDCTIHGTNGDWEDWSKAFIDYATRCEKTEYKPGYAPNAALYSALFDEMTGYADTLDTEEDRKAFSLAIKRIVSASRKAMRQIILISHCLTNASFPAGCYDLIKRNANTLVLTATRASLAIGKGYFIEINDEGDLSKSKVTVPKWFSLAGLKKSIEIGEPVYAKYVVRGQKQYVTYHRLVPDWDDLDFDDLDDDFDDDFEEDNEDL
jgi:hypothetical protein